MQLGVFSIKGFFFLLSARIPYGVCIFQLGTYHSVVGSLSHSGEFCLYVSVDKAQGTVGISGNSVYVGIPRQASRDINPKYLALVTASRTCPCK